MSLKQTTVQPKNKDHLKELIREAIKQYGPQANLNFIDVSQTTDMTYLFKGSHFNGDISQWDMSKVKYMDYMFSQSHFNGDISKWNVPKAENMFANSRFNGDISQWDTPNVIYMQYMFTNSSFNGDLSTWRVSRVEHMGQMFFGGQFNGDIGDWNLSSIPKLLKKLPNFCQGMNLEDYHQYWVQRRQFKQIAQESTLSPSPQKSNFYQPGRIPVL